MNPKVLLFRGGRSLTTFLLHLKLCTASTGGGKEKGVDGYQVRHEQGV